MPIYEYQCKACGNTFTKIVFSPDDRPTSPPCPECNGEETRRVISAPSIAIGSSESGDMSEEAARQQAREASRQDLNEALKRGGQAGDQGLRGL